MVPALALDQFGFVETIYSFSEGIVVGIPRCCRPMVQCLLRPNARYSEWINIARPLPGRALCNNVPRGAIRVMDQSAFLDGPSIVQGLFKSIENKVSFRRPGDPPSNNAISECVDNKSHIDKTLPG